MLRKRKKEVMNKENKKRCKEGIREIKMVEYTTERK
jgi:hypothetical protein